MTGTDVIRAKVGILPEVDATDELIASLVGDALEAANRLSSTPITSMRFISRTSWSDALGERPDDMRFDYLIYEGTGTRNA